MAVAVVHFADALAREHQGKYHRDGLNIHDWQVLSSSSVAMDLQFLSSDTVPWEKDGCCARATDRHADV
jgi:hypothetical protein